MGILATKKKETLDKEHDERPRGLSRRTRRPTQLELLPGQSPPFWKDSWYDGLLKDTSFAENSGADAHKRKDRIV
jgi:hypothetical protein